MVIAIIAILAAILFPVFAQAKLAAKGAASISNAKQLSLACITYGNDYDDMFVLGGQWNSQDMQAAHPSGGAIGYMPWTGLIEPYKKDLGINNSPFVGATHSPYTFSSTNHCDNPDQCEILYPGYGYNTAYLSPTYYKSPYQMAGTSNAAVASPSNLVVLTEIWSPNESRWGGYTAGSPYFYVSIASAEPPQCNYFGTSPSDPVCLDPWGVQSYRDSVLKTIAKGAQVGGIAFRYIERTATAFADGHVRKMSPEELAQGTNWVRNVTPYSQVTRTGVKPYLWDPKEG